MRRAVRRVSAWVVGAGLLAVLVAVLAGTGKREAIARAQAEAALLQQQRDSLIGIVAQRDQAAAALTVRLEQYRRDANGLRDSVTALERRRAASQLDVRRLRTVGALQDRLRAAFPELGDSAWGLTTLPLPGDTLGLEYLMVPAWFAETFVIDRANAESWRAQRERLLIVDSLRVSVAALQDSVTRLVAANAAAYETGYRAAYAGYEQLSRRYVAELRKPRIDIPSPIGLLGAAAVGFVVGAVVR